MENKLHVLIITSEYPRPEYPDAAPFIAREVESLKSAGVNIDLYAFRGRKRLFNYFLAWVQAHNMMKKTKYDLIHAHFGQSGLLALFPKIYPLAVTFRGSDVEGILDKNSRYTLQGKVLQLVSRFVARRADECILVSSSMLKKMPKRKYHIIPSGIDLDLFKPCPKDKARKTLGLSLEKQYILFGGNPEQPVKRFKLALEVMQHVRNQLPDVELITPRMIPHSMMPVYMNACDVLLMTSSHEGSPNMIKEALACNLPIVSTKVGDVEERIGEVEGCFVSNTNSPQKLADYVTKVLKQGIEINGRKYVSDLDEKISVNKVLAVYHKVIRSCLP